MKNKKSSKENSTKSVEGKNVLTTTKVLKTTFIVTLPVERHQKMKDLAYEKHVSAQALYNEAIINFLKEHKKI